MKMFKSILIIIVVLSLTVVILHGARTQETQVKDPPSALPDESPEIDLSPEINAIQLCFDWKNEGGDKAMLSMDLRGDKVIGEFYWLPFQKDSKVGVFKGDVTAVDPMMMARTVNAIWEARAEGTVVKEELKIVFGEGNAYPGFGEMKDRGDGVYVYASPEKINYPILMTDVSCGDENMD